MRVFFLSLLMMIASMRSLLAQTATQPPPQSARQALIEMFLGKGPDDFAKHLPHDARAALIHKGETPETSTVLRIASFGRQMVSQGEHIETFDEGATLLVSQQANSEKIEVIVERDSLMGEEDEIELSIRVSKDGQPQFLPVIPRLIFAMMQESEIWRLAEVTVAAHIPLTDPDYLKGVRKEQDGSDESAALGRMYAIVGAENDYAAQHPEKGYACSIADLFPATPGIVSSYRAPMANEEANGYRFKLSGCDPTGSQKYRLTAVPIDPDAEIKSFCADESGTIRSSTNASTCSRSGDLVGTPTFKPSVE